MITTERTGGRRRAALVAITVGTLATTAGVTAKRADAQATGRTPTPVYLASLLVKTPPLERPLLVKRSRLVDQAGPDPDPGRALEPVAVTLHLTGAEVELLRGILHEAVSNDLDLIEDTIYQTALVDQDAVARVALAVRLDVGMG